MQSPCSLYVNSRLSASCLRFKMRITHNLGGMGSVPSQRDVLTNKELRFGMSEEVLPNSQKRLGLQVSTAMNKEILNHWFAEPSHSEGGGMLFFHKIC